METFLNIKKIIVAIPGIAMYLSFLRKVVTPAKAGAGIQFLDSRVAASSAQHFARNDISTCALYSSPS